MHSRVGSFCFALRRGPHLSDAACCENRRIFFPRGCGSADPLAFGRSQKPSKQKQTDGETFTPSRLERKRPPSNDSMLSTTVAAEDTVLQAHPPPATAGALAVDADVTAGVLLWGMMNRDPAEEQHCLHHSH